MLSQIAPIMDGLNPSQVTAIAIVGMGVFVFMVVALAGILATNWASVTKARLETALKQQMIERGMSAEEIIKILSVPSSTPPTQIVDYPCASEVVVDCDGDFCPALILKREDDRYFVHYVGHDLSDNEWVPGARIRFPRSSEQHWESSWDRTGAAEGFGENHGFANGKKPVSVDREI